MNVLTSWLAMGGYAGYVWSAYGFFCLVVVTNVLAIKWQRKRAKKTLQRWFRESC